MGAGEKGDDASDIASFETVYRASYSRLVGQLWVLTTNRTEAEEVVQEAFARLWASWTRRKGYDDLESWVRRIAINIAITRWRRSSRHDRSVGAPETQEGLAESDIAVQLVLRELPAKQRSALLLHHVVGLSIDEIARELSSRPGTVKSWLSRGRTELSRRLSEKGRESYD